jgi:hypothetical protein
MIFRVRWLGPLVSLCLVSAVGGTACGESTHGPGANGGNNAGGSVSGSAGSSSAGSSSAGTTAPGSGGDAAGNAQGGDAAAGDAGAGGAADAPAFSCADAKRQVGYLGCEFWPTFVANPVWSTFSPGIALANEGKRGDPTASVTVDGPGGFHHSVQVPPGSHASLEVPWVTDLKGPQWSAANTSGGRLAESRRVNAGAYHVQSDAPIAVWQLNPAQQQQVDDGCPQGTPTCRASSNDATLLLPTHALTGKYRVFTYSGKNEGDDWGSVPGGFAITATADATQVDIQLGPRCGTQLFPSNDLGPCTASGPSLTSRNASEVITLSLNAGDVLQLMGAKAKEPTVRNADLSGTIVNASQPVQVISFASVANIPDISVANSDHLEEVQPPAESLDKRYVVVPPSAPQGESQGHVVRIYGHVDGTKLSYPEGKPAGAPDVINAGDVAQIPPLPAGVPAESCITVADHCVLNEAFVVEGDQPFAVASFMPGGVLQSPGTDATNSSGDPALSFVIPPSQFRRSFTFFIPEGYTSSWLDLLVPKGTPVELDAKPLRGAPKAIGISDWTVLRVPVTQPGLHRVTTPDARGVGGQIETFAFASALYYAAGANQLRLSKPPLIVVP